jgi:lactoylglutathione lyase
VANWLTSFDIRSIRSIGPIGTRHHNGSPVGDREIKGVAMTATMSSPITGIRTVSIPVENQDDALRFYVGNLDFRLLRDVPTPKGRWIELAPGDGGIVLTLEPAKPDITRGAIGIRFTTADIESAHSTLESRGVEVDRILRWPGIPAMFAFRDPDGNAYSITATA